VRGLQGLLEPEPEPHGPLPEDVQLRFVKNQTAAPTANPTINKSKTNMIQPIIGVDPKSTDDVVCVVCCAGCHNAADGSVITNFGSLSVILSLLLIMISHGNNQD